ncbi:hypothetical protein KQI69_01640 [Eubacterium sp. MSJ-13]|uniref:hypothetical protein n=1 Tax=Eubacterium sp. MSJ-13 TaxID=2841513 RepID=UPI001C11ECB6|nr:hypothetical protein [Eubacterium sp. MSJ-13]MBU5477901.1 hypothetical protein [Eubacterium sp. MSJ-13]
MGNFFIRIKSINNKYSLHITGAACIGNFVVGLGKLIVGLISLSFFTCVSAFYTFGMVIAKMCALKGIGKSREKQYAHYRLTGIILIVASVLYAIYSTRLLFKPEVPHYGINVGLAIATFTFTEIGLNIRGVIVERKNKELLYHALKMVSLAASLISLVLTQTALLSFTHEDVADYDPSFSNGIMGLLMGCVSTIIGIFMLLRVRGIQCKKQ